MIDLTELAEAVNVAFEEGTPRVLATRRPSRAR